MEPGPGWCVAPAVPAIVEAMPERARGSAETGSAVIGGLMAPQAIPIDR
jgi:hypothetical protein